MYMGAWIQVNETPSMFLIDRVIPFLPSYYLLVFHGFYKLPMITDTKLILFPVSAVPATDCLVEVGVPQIPPLNGQ